MSKVSDIIDVIEIYSRIKKVYDFCIDNQGILYWNKKIESIKSIYDLYLESDNSKLNKRLLQNLEELEDLIKEWKDGKAPKEYYQ